jgi:hypothetical protein
MRLSVWTCGIGVFLVAIVSSAEASLKEATVKIQAANRTAILIYRGGVTQLTFPVPESLEETASWAFHNYFFPRHPQTGRSMASTVEPSRLLAAIEYLASRPEPLAMTEIVLGDIYPLFTEIDRIPIEKGSFELIRTKSLRTPTALHILAVLAFSMDGDDPLRMKVVETLKEFNFSEDRKPILSPREIMQASIRWGHDASDMHARLFITAHLADRISAERLPDLLAGEPATVEEIAQMADLASRYRSGSSHVANVLPETWVDYVLFRLNEGDPRNRRAFYYYRNGFKERTIPSYSPSSLERIGLPDVVALQRLLGLFPGAASIWALLAGLKSPNETIQSGAAQGLIRHPELWTDRGLELCEIPWATGGGVGQDGFGSHQRGRPRFLPAYELRQWLVGSGNTRSLQRVFESALAVWGIPREEEMTRSAWVVEQVLGNRTLQPKAKGELLGRFLRRIEAQRSPGALTAFTDPRAAQFLAEESPGPQRRAESPLSGTEVLVRILSDGGMEGLLTELFAVEGTEKVLKGLAKTVLGLARLKNKPATDAIPVLVNRGFLTRKEGAPYLPKSPGSWIGRMSEALHPSPGRHPEMGRGKGPGEKGIDIPKITRGLRGRGLK